VSSITEKCEDLARDAIQRYAEYRAVMGVEFKPREIQYLCNLIQSAACLAASAALSVSE
jgi:hypothetical protein